FGRLRHKLLSLFQAENEFLYVLHRVFFRNHDYIWVEDIPRSDWVTFFETLGLSLHIDDRRILRQLLHSLNTLSFQVAQVGLEKDVLHYLPEQYQEENPFVAQSYLVHQLEEKLSEQGDRREALVELAEKIKAVTGMCHECIDYV